MSLPDATLACPSVPRRRCQGAGEAAPKPEFDLASLPSLDFDHSGHRYPRLPFAGRAEELARAALRRAWSADPAICDFKGLAENDWDFTDPTAMPGSARCRRATTSRSWWRRFSARNEKPVTPGISSHEPPASRCLTFCRTKSRHRHTGREATPFPQEKRHPLARDSQGQPASGPQNDFVQRDNNIASHNSISGDEIESPRIAARMAAHCLSRKLYP